MLAIREAAGEVKDSWRHLVNKVTHKGEDGDEPARDPTFSLEDLLLFGVAGASLAWSAWNIWKKKELYGAGLVAAAAAAALVEAGVIEKEQWERARRLLPP